MNSIWLFLWLRFLPIGLSLYPNFKMKSMASLLIILLTQAATGWIIGRTHRSLAVPMALVFAIWLSLWGLANEFAGPRVVIDNATHHLEYRHPEYRPVLAWDLTPIGLEVIGLFFGAALAANPRRRAVLPHDV
jgi:hypothetical protein